MRNSLLNLMQLQKVDRELQALEDLKGDLPQQVRKLESDLNGLKIEHTKDKNELEEVKRSKLHWEGELKAFQEKLRKYQEQLYAVTSNREYDAITLEIDSMKEKADEAETQVLECLEKEEQISEKVKNLESDIEIRQEDLQNKQRELDEKIKATESKYQVWENKRKDLVSHLTKPILHQYERIRKVKGATTVVSVNKYACGGCFSSIPPQKVVEIRSMNQIITCESCGRILVYEGEKVAVAN